jgi:tetratricopeptide (TPR) repeat protein
MSPTNRRRLRGLLALVVLLGCGVGAAWWWYHTSRADYRLGRGREAVRRRDWAGAERLALRLEADGNPDHARLLRGQALYEQARPSLEAGRPESVRPLLEQALQELDGVRDQGEIRLEAVALAGQCLLYLGERVRAERALRFVIRERPDHADAHRGLAALYFDQGALALAVDHLEVVARLDPGDGRPHRFLGHIYKDLGQDAQAVAAFREALRRDLGAHFAEDVKENLAELLVKRGDHAPALALLEECRPAPAGRAKVLALRAECLTGQGRTPEAQALLDQALETYPASPELLRSRAKLYLESREPAAAARLLERAVSVDGHEFTTHHLLAQAYEGLGRRAEAADQRRRSREDQDALQELSRLNREAMDRPWDAPVRRRLAAVCEKLGKPDLAAMWQQAAEAAARKAGAPPAGADPGAVSGP